MQVRRRGKITRLKPADKSRAHRVVEHGRQETALHDPGRVQERLARRDRDLDRPLVRADRH
jgi:hypothetical protein